MGDGVEGPPQNEMASNSLSMNHAKFLYLGMGSKTFYALNLFLQMYNPDHEAAKEGKSVLVVIMLD